MLCSLQHCSYALVKQVHPHRRRSWGAREGLRGHPRPPAPDTPIPGAAGLPQGQSGLGTGARTGASRHRICALTSLPAMGNVVAIDAGTTGVRALVVDEQAPVEIWDAMCATLAEVGGRLAEADGTVAAIGITNQRETLVAFDRSN